MSLRHYERAMKSAADPTRFRILKMLEGGELCVCQLVAVLGLSQSTVSKHLFLLKTGGVEAVRDIVGKVWPYVLAGIGARAAIHGYAPENVLAGIMGAGAWWSVPAAVGIGIPLDSNAAGIIPIVQALLEKGVALGTVLAFMMSVIGLSLPEMIILRKVLRLPLIAVFAGVVGAGILGVGYVFNALM